MLNALGNLGIGAGHSADRVKTQVTRKENKPAARGRRFPTKAELLKYSPNSERAAMSGA